MEIICPNCKRTQPAQGKKEGKGNLTLIGYTIPIREASPEGTWDVEYADLSSDKIVVELYFHCPYCGYEEEILHERQEQSQG